MAIVPLQKVAITWHKDIHNEVMDFLHDEGILHIVNSSEETKDALESPVLFTKADLEYAYTTLEQYADKNTKRNVARQKNTVHDIKHTMNHFDFLGLIEELRNMETEDTESTATITTLQESNERSVLWSEYPYKLEQSTVTEYSTTLIGTVPVANAEQFLTEFADFPIQIDTLQVTETVQCFVCTILTEKREQFERVAENLGWQAQVLPQGSGSVEQFIQTNTLEIKTFQKQRTKNKQRREELALELGKIRHGIIFTQWLNEKHTAHQATLETDSSVTIYGWMPKKEVNSFEAKLQRKFPATTLEKLDIGENEEPPVYIRNSKLLMPFESVTTLYGLPNNSEIDPTPPLSPFFIIFFALCLTDAGYGAALALLTGIYLYVKKLTIEEAKLPWLLFFSGIVTVAVSIPFGGWFGLLPTQVPEIFTKTTAAGEILFKGQIWNLGAQSGITFLQNLALGLGVIHLFYGMFLAGMHKWKHGRKMEAVWVDFSNHLLLAAIIFAVAAPTDYKQIAMYTLYAAIAIFVWGKGHGNSLLLRPIFGALGAMNFLIGFVSNSLSYLRILALGLVTGAIALAVNQVAIEFSKFFPWYLQIPVIIVICLAGHTISIALNTLGSFIHSGRLQFIEFFGQFFEGGGKEFTPFKRSC